VASYPFSFFKLFGRDAKKLALGQVGAADDRGHVTACSALAAPQAFGNFLRCEELGLQRILHGGLTVPDEPRCNLGEVGPSLSLRRERLRA
jgi:hypothetical protein